MKKKLLSLVILGVGTYLIISLSAEIFDLFKKGEEVKKDSLEVEKLRVANEELKKQLEYVRSEEFLEKEAREKLGLAREGETVYVLPKEVEEMTKARKEKREEEIPNWEKWWKLFF